MAEVKKMAHSSAATPEQAGRENHWKCDVSHQKHTTQGPGGQRKIADLLSYGQENAIPRRHLEKLTGLDGRTVRLMIERERHEGVPILADNVTGYYLPATEHERAACVRSMRHRAAQIMRTARAIERGGD